jgi:hypothetical protein
MPLPVAKASHATDPLPANVGSKDRPEPVPPLPDRLMADIDAALESRSSTFLSDSGKRTYISTAKRITSGEELK